MTICKNCKLETTNPVFCCRSCSTSYNNRINPKRKPEHVCKTCGIPINSDRKYCKNHVQTIGNPLETLEDLQYNEVYKSSRDAKIRSRARTVYKKSNKPKYCIICKYDKHYEVCHITAISKYNKTALVSNVNHITNLIALCPNHHWEFDNGLLKITFEQANEGLSAKDWD